jgi:hypothetical protein
VREEGDQLLEDHLLQIRHLFFFPTCSRLYTFFFLVVFPDVVLEFWSSEKYS